MERRINRFQRPNPNHQWSSSTSSSREPTTSRSNKFSANPRESSKPTESSDDSRSRGRRSTTHQQKKQEQQEYATSDHSAIVGTCSLMCPESERTQRERLRDLAVFERLNGNPAQSSASLAVKKFCRTLTTKEVQASDVRPLPVLEDTLNYLLTLLDNTEHHFEVVHDFIFDRTRSIRQDISMQNIVNDKAIHMYQEMVQFHIISHHKLRSCHTSPNTASVHYLNMEQLIKTLTSLFNLYEANRSSNSTYKNEAEFRSFYVLLHLGSNRQPMGESLSVWFRNMSSPITNSKEMSFARKILRYFRMGNYRRFLTVTESEASYLQYCIIEPYVSEVRILALSCINNCGYKLHPYPFARLSKLLMMKESDLESFCKACGLEICMDEEGNKLLPTKQTTFSCPKEALQCYSFTGLGRFET
ncbi:SAC3 family protein C isoform X1 [Ziziphus jujuba]|uniref:SAC3 family protein C isoform X1 n=1 Tax=Ziziphus jujuba TaxID=326968 RepID=A0ABM3IDK1_ZIZJJ|nr:SAC3 family protein C isoform X1 [Ziziphus jujuba]